MRKFLSCALFGAALAAASPALADAGQSAPVGSVFSLTGQQQSTDFVQYAFSFIAADPFTNLTFALRNDPTYIRLDDISLSTGGGANLLLNGGFEDGVAGTAAPVGWSYLNQYGASAGGTVSGNGAHSGNLGYYDGAVGAYDAITQLIETTVGTRYDVTFWAAVNAIGGTGFYQELSTNGSASSSGDGIDLFVYAGTGAPVAAVPEPMTWLMMIAGFACIGATLRTRRRPALESTRRRAAI